MPRPKLSLDEIRNIDVTVALSRKEFEKISARAQAAKKRIASYLRYAALGDNSLKIVPEANKEVAKYLRELLHLLTQFTVLLQQHQITIFDPIFFVEMQKELRRMHADFLNYADD